MRFLIITIGLALSANFALAKSGGYREFYAKAEKEEEIEPAVSALRKEAFDAVRNGDMARLANTFAKRVKVYIGKSDPADLASDHFKHSTDVARDNLVVWMGGHGKTEGTLSDKQKRRAGVFAFSALLRGPQVGFNGQMNGAICNRPVNKPDEKVFSAALKETKSRPVQWVIAKHEMGPSDTVEAPGQYPTKIYKDQMVLQTDETHGDNRWISIAAPQGGDALFYQRPASFAIAPFFSKYIAEHVCFGKIEGSWKIISLALRVN